MLTIKSMRKLILLFITLLYLNNGSAQIINENPKNYLGFNTSIFVNEASFSSTNDYVFGSGYSFGINYQRQVLKNDNGSLFATFGFDGFNIGYNGWLENQNVKENFIANERYGLISLGFIASLNKKDNPLDHLDLEILFAYWFLGSQAYNTVSTRPFPKAESRLSTMFYPHYSHKINKTKFTIGPFANIDLAEFRTSGSVFDLALIGIKTGIGIGF